MIRCKILKCCTSNNYLHKYTELIPCQACQSDHILKYELINHVIYTTGQKLKQERKIKSIQVSKNPNYNWPKSNYFIFKSQWHDKIKHIVCSVITVALENKLRFSFLVSHVYLKRYYEKRCTRIIKMFYWIRS